MVGKIERGDAAASFETIGAIAAALQLPVSSLFQVGQISIGQDRQALARLMTRLAELTDADLEWVERVLDAASSRPA